MKLLIRSIQLLIFSLLLQTAHAQITPAPDRNEGGGPYPQLIIRGVTLINGTGSPAVGPVDIVIENNRIVKIVIVANEGLPIKLENRPLLTKNGKEIDANGMYAMPGLIDMHAHIGGTEQGTPAEYVYKLWMAHGITTVF